LAHTVGVFATLFAPDGRVVLVRQSYAGSCWTQPGGRLEAGEAPVEGLAREIREETGIEARIDGYVGTYVTIARNDVLLHFRASVLARQPWSATDEIIACDDFNTDDLPSPMRPHTRARISDGVTGRSNVFRSILPDKTFDL
jgi:ADP-ribose pyrophosphatase YjhB (NUDIX family)